MLADHPQLLVKSIMELKAFQIANYFAVVQNPYSFSSEIPEDLVLRLPVDPGHASNALCKALADGWSPPISALESWLMHFRESNRNLFERVFTVGNIGQEHRR